MKTLSYRRDIFILLLLLLSAFILTLRSPIHEYAKLDAHGALLTSQALIEHQTLELDAYLDGPYGWQINYQNNHLYYAYPIGTPLFSVPFVLVGRMFGLDMQNQNDELLLQHIIASTVVVIVGFLTYIIARQYNTPRISLIITSIWVLGSGIITTLGLALWSMNFATVWLLLAILQICRYKQAQQINPWLLGIFLFLAYFCRPTSVLLAVATVGYFIVRQHFILAMKISLGFAALFVVLVAGSLITFHSVLPFYYNPIYLSQGQIRSISEWLEGVYGLLFSPGRGLFVYQLFLIPLMIGLIIIRFQVDKSPAYFIAWVWIGLHFFLLSRWRMWWGGGSYGSRLMVDSFPAWIAVSAIVIGPIMTRLKRIPLVLWAGSMVLCGLCSIYIHSVQGLYNHYTWDWNTLPGSNGEHPINMFDWQHPAFLTNEAVFHQLSEQQK